MKNIALSLCLVALAPFLSAKDYGVQGNVFEIIEKDIRQSLMESAADADWKKAADEAQESAKTYIDRLPKRGFGTADKTFTTWVDPSMVLSSDIQAPMQQPDGSYAWRVLHPKGTRVNPLQYSRPITGMFFFDGSKPEQVELLRELLEKEPFRLVPVEAGAGNLNTLSGDFQRPIFYASDAMLSRFQVRHLPSLLYPGDGERNLYLGVTAYAMPFSAATVLKTWSGFFTEAKPSSQKSQVTSTPQ